GAQVEAAVEVEVELLEGHRAAVVVVVVDDVDPAVVVQIDLPANHHLAPSPAVRYSLMTSARLSPFVSEVTTCLALSSQPARSTGVVIPAPAEDPPADWAVELPQPAPSAAKASAAPKPTID